MTSRFSLLIRQTAILTAAMLAFALPAPAYAHARPNDGFTADLVNFIEKVRNENPDELRGVFVQGKFAYPVVQQPSDQPLFVSTNAATVTQYRSAAKNQVVGLLAHNYLAGASFYTLEPGDRVHLVFGDGRVKVYVISEILQYQVVTAGRDVSAFKDVKTREILSEQQIYDKVYGLGDKVTFQTCIPSGSNGTWGRLFVIAYPTD